MSRRMFAGVKGGGVKVQLRPEERELLAELFDALGSRLRARDADVAPAPAPKPESEPSSGPDQPDDTEAALFAQLAGLGSTDPLPPPDDAVLARLLPDGVRDDAEASAEFRRFSEGDLRRSKQRCLDVAAAALRAPASPAVLDVDQTQCLLKALNDVRLAQGAILGLESDEDTEWMEAALEAVAEAEGEEALLEQLGLDPRWVALASLYEYLGGLQATLLDCLTD